MVIYKKRVFTSSQNIESQEKSLLLEWSPSLNAGSYIKWNLELLYR